MQNQLHPYQSFIYEQLRTTQIDTNMLLSLSFYKLGLIGIKMLPMS